MSAGLLLVTTLYFNLLLDSLSVGYLRSAKFNINAADVDTGKSLTLDYAGGSSVTVNWLDRLAGSTTVRMTGIDRAGNYEINTSGGTLAKVFCGLYEVTSGAAAGMYSIGCTWGYGTRAELEGANEIYDAERFA